MEKEIEILNLEENNYKEVISIIETLEVNSKVRQLQDNTERLKSYWNIGRLIVESQNGEKRAKYGDNLIKKWSKNLTSKFGKFYGITNLKYMRLFYLLFSISHTVYDQLSWSHYKILLPLKNENERNYYINQAIINNLSVRNLQKEIKSKSFERLSYADKQNIKLIESNNYSLSIEDMIKDPIIIKIDDNTCKLTEKALHHYIINMLKDKFLELGTGFALVGHEYKINVAGRNYSIDLLFFNIKLNCYVVIELKLNHLSIPNIDQIHFYTSLIDQNIKEFYHHKTIGLIIGRKKDQFIIEYATSKNIYTSTYLLEQ